jgi:hypothetical protein
LRADDLRRETVLAALGGVALAVLMSWPLVLHLGSDIAKDIGDPLFETWQLAWIGHALLEDPLDLWQANVFWPYRDTLAFSDALIGYAPAALIAQASPHAALVTYNVLFLLAYALAFVGAYLLARELGIGWIGAAAAGAAFAYAPWKLAQNGHLHVVSSGGIPLALFLLVRGYRRRSAATILAGWLVAAWQMTLGFTLGLQLASLLGILVVLAVVGIWRRWLPRPDRAVVIATAVGMVLFVVVSGLMARPYLRVIDAHPEAERTPAYIESFSPRPRSFLAAPQESFLWDDITARARASLPAPHEASFFPGLVVALLALVGVLGSLLSRPLRIGLVIGVIGCALLSLGVRDVEGLDRYATPYRFLYDFVPGFDGVRAPGRINTLTSLGLALLAGAGLCIVVGALRKRSNRLAVLVGGVAVAAVLVEGVGPLTHPPVPEAPSAMRLEQDPQFNLPAGFHVDLRYSYWTIDGFPRTVNGAAAIDPRGYDDLRGVTATFPDARSVRVLRDLGVKTVILHRSLVGHEFGAEGVETRPIAGLGIERERVGDTIVFRLRPS